MRTLILAEKPSVARDIARVLGVKQKGEGMIAGEVEGELTIVTWAVGHLVTLCEPGELDPVYKKWTMAALPMLPPTLKTKVIAKTKAQFQVIKSLMNRPDIDRVICATDSGREGELIFRYIYAQAGCTKPVERLWISSMTDAAIRDGFRRLRPSRDYDALFQSARCRAEADWLVGMNASRAFSLKFDAHLSMGRVQTPTLKLIVERDREIQSFVPEEYHEIRANFGDYSGLWIDPEKQDARCMNAALAEQVVREVKGQRGQVTEARYEDKATPPPQLYDLTALQRDANRLLGLSASKTLEIAQALYDTHKLITYPRTDSRYLPRDMIGGVKKALTQLPTPWQAFAEPLLQNQPVPGRIYNDAKVTDHHAIIPTGHRIDLGRLSERERQVFDLVARRFIAAHYPDYRYESAIVKTMVGSHTFRTNGQTPIDLGWRALYREIEKEESDPVVPRVSVGDARQVKSVTSKKLKTKPPSPHTDASLLSMMERAGKTLEDEALRETMKLSGLGTPATRAATIERLIQVGYVARRGKALLSTEKGERLIQVAPDEMTSAEMTGKWERALSHMARETDHGLLDQRAERFMASIRRYATFLVEAARQSSAGVTFEKEAHSKGKGKSALATLGKPCPLCGQGQVTANQRAFGCSRWREGCHFTVWRDQLTRQGGPTLSVNDMKKLLDGKTIPCEAGEIRLSQGQLILMPSTPPR